MKLTNREKTWKERKAKSHPTYDQWGKKAGTFEERLKTAKCYEAWSDEGLAEREKFYAEHGRQWQVFDFYDSITSTRQKAWIESYK